jgi:hypothetical protein
MISSDLLTYDLGQHPLPPPAVKLPVKDPLPGAKIETAVGYRDDDLAAHYLPFQMRVRVILAGAVVPVLLDRRVRRQLLLQLTGLDTSPLCQITQWLSPAKGWIGEWTKEVELLRVEALWSFAGQKSYIAPRRACPAVPVAPCGHWMGLPRNHHTGAALPVQEERCRAGPGLVPRIATA